MSLPKEETDPKEVVDNAAAAAAAAASSTMMMMNVDDNNNNDATSYCAGNNTILPNKKHKKRTLFTTDGPQQQQQQQQQQPLTEEGSRPQKKFYRQRAHCNPLSHNDAFTYPRRPDLMDWTVEHYPAAATAATAGAATAAAAGATAAAVTRTAAEQQSESNRGSSSSNNINNNNNTIIITTPQNKIAPTILDIGCGFGGLTMALGKLPQEQSQHQVFILGMEIRAKVTEYVRLRILAARKKQKEEEEQKQQQQHADDNTSKSKSSNHRFLGLYQNCSVLRTNSMKFLPNYLERASIDKLFFCFPDPHFKRKNHPRRIISDRLLSEYAYLLKPDSGKLYCITDVLELHQWHTAKCNAHPLFEQIPVDNQEVEHDPCVQAMKTETEEGKKVEREGREKYYAVYRRIQDSQAMVVNSSNFFIA